MTNERFEEVNSIINGIARKYASKMYSRSEEDLRQDLWVKVLETEKRKGYELEGSMIARICYDYIKDLIDYDQRRNHINRDYSGTGYVENETSDAEFFGAIADKGDYASKMMIDGLYDKFPEGSKERIYLDFWGNYSGVMPNTRAIPPDSRTQDGYTERNLAYMLGYAGPSSGGYRRFRKKMHKIISDYFGLNEE